MIQIDDMYIDTITYDSQKIYRRNEWYFVIMLNNGTEERVAFYKGMGIQSTVKTFYNLLTKLLNYTQ
jgi:hypothetical protein